MQHASRRLVAAFIGSLFCIGIAAADDAAAPVRTLIDAGRHPDLAWSSLDDVRNALEQSYAATAYTPIWLRAGRPTDQARAVVSYIETCEPRGLRPADYDAGLLRREIERIEATPSDIDGASRFEVAMTTALLRLLHHTAHGRVDPKRFGFGLDSERMSVNLQPAVLDIAGSSDPAARIAAFEPPFPLFYRLLHALALYRGLAQRTDLPVIPDGPTLHPGESSPATAPLRETLIALGDLPADTPTANDASLYDGALVEAVKHFQRRHGLDDDGAVGRATRNALGVPLAKRTKQIELAIERLRWLPRETPDRFIIVNIPEFRLHAFERGQEGPVMSSDVVVGSAARRNETPILHAEMQYLVFRPYWNVPPSIARNELMPKVDGDEGYLGRNNMEIVDGRIRQRPGPNNSLGLVKFIFPNRHHVYLHDTPAKALFGRSRRDFSHGCIRVARPVDLAEFILRGQDNWTEERIVNAMQKGRDNQHVRLQSPVAVYLLYTTVMIGRDGELRFYDDLYGHDDELHKTLAKGFPYS